MESAIWLFTRQVLAFFRVNPAKSFNQPDFFIRSACFDQSWGQPRVNPGKQEGGGVKKIKKSTSFLFEVSCSQRRVFDLHVWRNLEREEHMKCEVDALGVITISRGCFERCCSNKKTPPYHANLGFGLTRGTWTASNT